ncbi:FAD-dependent oxidoreductase [Gordonia rubripertincta]|uniref:ferredoxin--NADP(+) reductase n=1 Tax=Gordonia rubripertincta TaxID=36822 RepID=A0ABT4MQE5_GORRU|nr:FAD-dependent oxidoreductase [Gordonia rubripertincta]MCZ4549228.1 FAD-dependent oxidoreductase [Gordonia rubripertincta]
MAHVITQPCCNDATCVSVCPVNCIHPTPGEPGFGSADMLFIDPDTCIDCGSCIDACPVSAIFPEEVLTEEQERYLQINADYYDDHSVDAGLMSPSKPQLLPPDRRVRVAIVGAGPAAFYAAEELLKHPGIAVDMFDRLPTPYGLVRAGVAPDHASTKLVENTFAAVAANKAFTYYLGVEVGRHVFHSELADRYGAVLYAHGAAADKTLGIDGENLPGCIAATDFVAWYNGHPDHSDRQFDLSGDRAVVVGNGNVALDVARILLRDPADLDTTDIADHALVALRSSAIREVVLLARRGVAQAAYTIGEFLAIGDLPAVDVVIDQHELVLDDDTAQARARGTLDSTIATKLRIAEDFAARPTHPGNKRIVFRYLLSPIAVRATAGTGVDALECVRNEFANVVDGQPGQVVSTGEKISLPAGLVMRAVGYTGTGMIGLPFDSNRGVVPNDGGRVVDEPQGSIIPGLYVAGWIKRGATGGIGMNRLCGQETARAVIADVVADKLPEPSCVCTDVADIATARGAVVVGEPEWRNIDAAERSAGAGRGRPRVKLVRFADMVAAARGTHVATQEPAAADASSTT